MQLTLLPRWQLVAFCAASFAVMGITTGIEEMGKRKVGIAFQERVFERDGRHYVKRRAAPVDMATARPLSEEDYRTYRVYRVASTISFLVFTPLLALSLLVGVLRHWGMLSIGWGKGGPRLRFSSELPWARDRTPPHAARQDGKSH